MTVNMKIPKSEKDCLDVLEEDALSTLFFQNEPPKQQQKPEIYQQFKLYKPSTHSLWSHVLWNASKSLSDYLVRIKPENSVIIELGSGTGLPLLTCYGSGNTVIATDYPDEDVLETIVNNANVNLPEGHAFAVRGLVWGDADGVDRITSEFAKADLILMSDLVG
jgi:predicted nicotinamide N-methyase